MDNWPTTLRHLVKSYVLDAVDLFLDDQTISETLTTMYWERRHDATGQQWAAVLRQAPQLCTHCPDCPVIRLIRYGHMNWVARLLLDEGRRFTQTTVEFVLQYASIHGDVGILEILRTRLHASAEDVRKDDSQALRRAMLHGNLNVLQDFRRHWGLTPNDARALDNEGLKAAAFRCVEILRELRLHWSLGRTDAQSGCNAALRNAARCGNVAVLQEFRLHWGLGPDDARACHNEAIREAALGGHVAVLQELRLNWGLGPDDARDKNNQAIRNAASHGHVAVLQEFRLNWGLKKADVTNPFYLCCCNYQEVRVELELFT